VFTVAYLANQFPSPVEPYVGEEIKELRRRGVLVIAGSVRTPDAGEASSEEEGMICLQNTRVLDFLRAGWRVLCSGKQIADLLARILLRGHESPSLRAKALLHTWLGACYAVRLKGRGVAHIHVHHGYFGSWVGLVAARLLGAGFSMTLHGSDLLRNAVYLDVKIRDCRFCLTVSEYNRRTILERYPTNAPEKIFVTKLGVEPAERSLQAETLRPTERSSALRDSDFTLVSVGRLHAVKNHTFLLQACAHLRDRGLAFRCLIAGEGPERRNLESLIHRGRLQETVFLLGHLTRHEIDGLYERADIVVLTSQSEGIPLTLMEAMARGKILLAPAITGIPELILAGKTGFLYEPGSMGDFIARIVLIHALMGEPGGSVRNPQVLSAAKWLDRMRHGAQAQILHNFNRKLNLKRFGDLFVELTTPLERAS
jgi:glycosyltransferase involved in cell wall biosynthesis